MSPSSQDAQARYRVSAAVRRLSRLWGAFWAPLLAVLFGILLAPAAAQAGTVTIVDGADTPPVDGVYTDGYIQNYLAVTGSLTISTTGVVTGPDEIRVLQSAVITWTTGTTLTLDAGSGVIISGTLQHDGPATGEGGLQLLVSAVPTGTVIVGTGTQTVGVAAGSRHGLTRVQAGNLVLRGGDSGTHPYALLGFRAVARGPAYAVTGPISVTLSQNLSATGGLVDFAFVQIGHGGAEIGLDSTSAGNLRADSAVDAGGDVLFQGGSNRGYAQLGNGGLAATGNHTGDHRLSAGGDVTFAAGGYQAYTQLGNGGYAAIGNHRGEHRLSAGGDVTFVGGNGDNDSYVQMGNGGAFASGNDSDGHLLSAGGDVTFRGGVDNGAYVQLGNGGSYAFGNHNGGHRLIAGGDATFVGGSANDAYVQVGNGGRFADGDHNGRQRLSAGGDVIFQGGSDVRSYVQLGNGGVGVDGTIRGDLGLISTGSLTVTAGSDQDAYTMLGNGSDVRINTGSQGEGVRGGDISVRVGETAVFSGSQVGHLSAGGVFSVTQGSTLIGVSQNNPYANGTGMLLVTGVTTTSFSSAPDAVGGALRIYLPRAESQQISTNATFNGATFATANTIPPAQLAGFALFGDGPYIPDYSFYLGGQPDLAVTKTATPAGPLQPGDTLTYTVSFSNTGNITATGVVLVDSLPGLLTGTVASLFPDTGVVISETAGAPNFGWTVSDLGPGRGGQIVLSTGLQNDSLALGATFTNTAAINATGDISLTNNSAAVGRSIVAGATLTITKIVSGAVPANVWQFNGSGGIGSFTLPAIGGSTVITDLIPTTYTISETVQSGYTAAAACSEGASGTNSVAVTLDPGAAVGCTFTNTATGVGVRLWLPAIHVGKDES